MFESVKDLKKIIEEAQKTVHAKGEDALKKAFAELFDTYPEIKAIRWDQYTPYFNDGDSCEFGVHSFDACFEDTVEEDAEREVNGMTFEYLGYGFKERGRHPKASEAIKDLERAIPEDVMLAVFGDHAEIVATREGFDVLEYSHD
jgi:hypothetical protein